MAGTKAEERQQVIQEIESICDCARAVGIDFIVVINKGQDGPVHNLSTAMNVKDDHHVLDMVCSIHETWWKANHSGVKG